MLQQRRRLPVRAAAAPGQRGRAMTQSTSDDATALREELARLLGEMTVIELKALLIAITEIGRERSRDQRKVSTVKRRREK